MVMVSLIGAIRGCISYFQLRDIIDMITAVKIDQYGREVIIFLSEHKIREEICDLDEIAFRAESLSLWRLIPNDELVVGTEVCDKVQKLYNQMTTEYGKSTYAQAALYYGLHALRMVQANTNEPWQRYSGECKIVRAGSLPLFLAKKNFQKQFNEDDDQAAGSAWRQELSSRSDDLRQFQPHYLRENTRRIISSLSNSDPC